MFFVPLAPAGDVMVIVEVLLAPAASVSVVGEYAKVQPAELPWNVAPKVKVLDAQPFGSLLVTVTVHVLELPAGPLRLGGNALTVGACVQVTMT